MQLIDIPNAFLVIIFLLNTGLAFFTYSQNRKNSVQISFALFSLFVGLWGISIFFYRQIDDGIAALYYMKAAYLSALGIAASFYYFSIVFPENISLSRAQKLFLAIPTLLLFLALLVPNFLTKGTITHSWGKETILGIGEYLLFFLYFVTFFMGGLIRQWKKYIKASGLIRTQLLYIVTSVSGAGAFGMLFNLILPSSFLQDFRWIWLGPLFTSVIVVTITYAIVKKQLFDVRVILTEILVGIISILLFVNVLLSESLFEYTWKGALLVGFLLAGYLLIKSVMNEIRQREELQRAYAKLKELDEAKSEFVSIASHQLRTPLTAIKGYISMIMEGSYGNLNETQQKPMKSVYESNERLIRLVNDLLNISRIESGRIDMKWEKKNIEDVIKGAIEEIGIKAKEKKLKLLFEKPEESLPESTLDEEKIRNVLLNILDNAIRYTKKGKITIRAYQKQEADVRRQASNTPSSIIIEVKDTGDGMTQEELSHLFESFSRGGAGTRTSTEGAGLGLYIAKQFMKLHKGNIWAESEGRGEGSTFYVELPLVQ